MSDRPELEQWLLRVPWGGPLPPRGLAWTVQSGSLARTLSSGRRYVGEAPLPHAQPFSTQDAIVTGVTFVLIPGAGGSAWYWHLVDAELRQRGHDVVVVDLPAEDDTAGLPEYTDAVVAAIGDRSELVLVAQSMGAFTAPLVCERLPGSVSQLVLLNAMIPQAGETAGEWWANTGQAEAQREKDLREGRPTDVDFDPLTMFFHDVPQHVIDAAEPHNRRQSDTPFGQPWPLAAWPDVPTKLLTGRDDRLFPAGFQQRVARERLGMTPDEMPGGHLSALSYPEDLADRLEAAGAAEQTPARHRRAVRNPDAEAPSARRRRPGPRQPIEQVVADLDRMISALIEENRRLRRQVDQRSRQTADAPSVAVERTLRSILRRVSNARGGGTRTPRRRSASPASKTRGSTDPVLLERRRLALVKAREARAANRASS
jgi:pimeloyl-ACP methyl ester carboxylesterase